MIKRVVAAAGLCGSVTLMALAGFSGAASATSYAQPPAKVGVATSIGLTKAVKSAKFVNQNGVPETLEALKGKTLFLVPFLTLCGDTCPFTTGNLLQLQAKLNAARANNVEVIAITVDPYRDTRARISAYAKLIGASFQIWSETGPTSTPYITNKEFSSKNPVGKGDKNSNLTTLEKFFGWSAQVVPQPAPARTDWIAPYDLLSYDINHSDGFWVIDPNQTVRFASGDFPSFTGTLSKVLSTFMSYKSNIYNSPVYKGGWTSIEALQAIEWVDSKKL